MNKPCPIGGCYRPDRHFHYTSLFGQRAVEACDRGGGHYCEANSVATECYDPKSQPMFALSTVEALIRAAIADERAGIDPEPTWSLPHPGGCR